MRDPVDIPPGIQAHICHHTGEEGVIRATYLGDGHSLPLQVPDGANLLPPDQLEAAYVGTCQDDQRVPRVEPGEERSNEVQDDIDLASEQGLREQLAFRLNVMHLGESLALQELFGDIIRGNADGGGLYPPNRGRLGWRLCGDLPAMQANESCRPCQGQPTQKHPPAPAFSSLMRHGHLLPSPGCRSLSPL